MKRMLLVAGFSTLSFSVAFGAELILGDAHRGAELLRTQKCVSCHSIRGEGGTTAPDLGRMIGRRVHTLMDGQRHVEPRPGHVGLHGKAGDPEAAVD